MWPVFWFSVCFFLSSWSTADLTVVSNRITRAFSRSGVNQVVALEISKAFDSFRMLF